MWDGFRFGMMLQFSVGPICLLVFRTAGSYGLWAGLLVAAAAAVVDAAYITLAGTGAAALLRSPAVRRAARIFGFLILVLFGAKSILSALGGSSLPEVRLLSETNPGSVFLQGLVATGSNPLTILFWSGVFASEAAKRERGDLFRFGFGCVLSTVCFLSAVAGAGCLARSFLPAAAVAGLNIAVGLLLILFGVKLLLDRSTPEESGQE
jgi:threonine/homoserine/homoserine lactone efflux protein